MANRPESLFLADKNGMPTQSLVSALASGIEADPSKVVVVSPPVRSDGRSYASVPGTSIRPFSSEIESDRRELDRVLDRARSLIRERVMRDEVRRHSEACRILAGDIIAGRANESIMARVRIAEQQIFEKAYREHGSSAFDDGQHFLQQAAWTVAQMVIRRPREAVIEESIALQLRWNEGSHKADDHEPSFVPDSRSDAVVGVEPAPQEVLDYMSARLFAMRQSARMAR